MKFAYTVNNLGVSMFMTIITNIDHQLVSQIKQINSLSFT